MREGNILNFLESMCKFCKNPNEILYMSIQLGANLHRTPRDFFHHDDAPVRSKDPNKDNYGTKVSDDEFNEMLKGLGMNANDIPGLNDPDDTDFPKKKRGENPSFSNDVDE